MPNTSALGAQPTLLLYLGESLKLEASRLGHASETWWSPRTGTSFPATSIRALASERSAGSKVAFDGTTLTVEPLTADSFAGIDIAFFAAGTRPSLDYAPAAVAAGALVIDKAHRTTDNEGIVSVPNCCTIPLAMVLDPLRQAAELERVVVCTYQSASGARKDLARELDEQVQAIAAGRTPEANVLPHQLAHNVVPGGWTMAGDGYNEEEAKLVAETRKILEDPDLRVGVTCVRVPVPVGHSEAVLVETTEPLAPDRAREVLAAYPGIVVVDDPEHEGYPTAAMAAGRDEVFVGRIRRDPSVLNGLALWVVTDNLRKGAAVNGVQIAERAVELGAV